MATSTSCKIHLDSYKDTCADFAVLVDVDNLASLGYVWAGTEYERSDDIVGYDYNIPVGNDPAPGSRHVMYDILWES